MVLHQFQNLRIAQAFSDYLSQLQISNSIEHDSFHYHVVLNDLTQVERAQAELALFLENPNQEKYLSASWETGNTDTPRSELAYANSHLVRNFIDHAGWLTLSVFLFCVVIYALNTLGMFQPMQSGLAFFTYQPFDYSESWRFITPAFLHFSALHIVFNLLWWWQLAGVVEKQQGKQRLLLLFLFSAIASNLAQYFLVGPYFGGLSGVVYGLVGYCWLFGMLNKNSIVNLPNSYFAFLLGWLALGFIDVLPMNVANYAHLVGLLAGLLLAFVVSKLKL
ncbi:rhomboid family intramembrane serine protease GlpG [Psychromonas sp. psych-6C06]|nr:rhomboid family intramembrane serine protease GlpG [Psychromonas sp. psych-6C06]